MNKYDAAAAAKFHEQQGEPVLPIDQLHDHVYESMTPEDKAAQAALAGSKRRFRAKAV